MKSAIKKSKNTNQAKFKQLQQEFDEYKRNNEIKISAIVELRSINAKLEKDIVNWKELFYLLKDDHYLIENFQTQEWEDKARAMGITI